MAPNSIFNDYLGENVKDFYVNKKYSDITVRIIEEHLTTGPDPLSTISTGTHKKEIKCHKLLLHINSPYFAEVLDKQEEKIDELEVEVKEGEARFLEIMIAFFYDESVIKTLNIIDLVCLLEVAVTYARDHHQKGIVDQIENLDPDFESATLGLQKLYSIEKGSFSNIHKDLKLSLQKKFCTYLAKYFAPIEVNQEKHEVFLNLDYSALWYLLRGNEPVAMSENSLLVLITEWLAWDLSRQTPDIIQGLLTSIRFQLLDGLQLHALGIKHRIFNHWDGYKEWIFNSLEYFICPPEEKCKKDANNEALNRSVPHGINSWFLSKKNTGLTVGAIRWKVHMTTVEKGKKLEPTRHLLVHDGIKFTPKAITISAIEGDDSKLNMSLQMSSSYSMMGLRFVVGIVPASNNYDISDKYFSSTFAKAFLKWTDRIDVQTKSQNFDLWTISRSLVEVSNEYGMFVFLLPITDGEYKAMSGCYYKPTCACGYRIDIINNKCGYSRSHHHTYPGAKIILHEASNFSV